MSADDTRVHLQVRLDPRWLELPVRGDQDLDAWATEVVDSALSLRGRVERPAVHTLYEQTYAAIVEQLRGRAAGDVPVPAAAFALIADDDLLPLTVVELTTHALGGSSFDAFVDSLVVAPAERFAEPEVVEVATDLGPAVRLQQLRIVEEGEGQEPAVQTSVVYAWPGPTEPFATTLSAWFGSPVDAETSRSVLQELAASLRRAPG